MYQKQNDESEAYFRRDLIEALESISHSLKSGLENIATQVDQNGLGYHLKLLNECMIELLKSLKDIDKQLKSIDNTINDK